MTDSAIELAERLDLVLVDDAGEGGRPRAEGGAARAEGVRVDERGGSPPSEGGTGSAMRGVVLPFRRKGERGPRASARRSSFSTPRPTAGEPTAASTAEPAAAPGRSDHSQLADLLARGVSAMAERMGLQLIAVKLSAPADVDEAAFRPMLAAFARRCPHPAAGALELLNDAGEPFPHAQLLLAAPAGSLRRLRRRWRSISGAAGGHAGLWAEAPRDGRGRRWLGYSFKALPRDRRGAEGRMIASPAASDLLGASIELALGGRVGPRGSCHWCFAALPGSMRSDAVFCGRPCKEHARRRRQGAGAAPAGDLRRGVAALLEDGFDRVQAARWLRLELGTECGQGCALRVGTHELSEVESAGRDRR